MWLTSSDVSVLTLVIYVCSLFRAVQLGNTDFLVIVVFEF